MIPTAASVPLVVVNAIASAIWVGGLVAIFVVARAASRTLDPAQRVAFFRALGRAYGVVGTVALLVALATGAILLDDHPWDGVLIATAALAGALLLAAVAGMAQARAMTRLRRRALESGADAEILARVRRGAVLATALRAAIALITLALVVLGAVLVA
ncbi:MAG TPA: DUF4149 domain-containing protein [Solirubrobacterales bacterium]|nr:DUF4149 domain-containing protein [Solirubrobacterales bacterium]